MRLVLKRFSSVSGWVGFLLFPGVGNGVVPNEEVRNVCESPDNVRT